MRETGDIVNQAPPYGDVDLFASDPPLREAVVANGVAGEQNALSAFGRHWGSAAMFEQAHLANEKPPRLRAIWSSSIRPITASWPSMRAGLHTVTWNANGSPAAARTEVVRAARYYMVAQVENGHMCPITMTRAAVAAIAADPALLEQTMQRLRGANTT